MMIMVNSCWLGWFWGPFALGWFMLLGVSCALLVLGCSRALFMCTACLMLLLALTLQLPGFSAGLPQLSFLMASAGSWSAAWPSLQAATVAGHCSRELPGSCYSCFSAVIMLPSQLVSASHGFASVSWLWISFSCCSPRFQLAQLCFGSFSCFHTVAHGVQLDSQLDFQRVLCSYLAGSAAAGLLTFSLLGLYGLSLLVSAELSAGFNGSPAGIAADSHLFYGLCAFACPD
ncbi:unnamed protein product [Ilex paraguariensis]|uniref:NADH dehydrogenase subunit 6 n=1 Tax=Ilex paraguariensis TaxID=185542 RepID=A0ABC8R0Z8_9AQUA